MLGRLKTEAMVTPRMSKVTGISVQVANTTLSYSAHMPKQCWPLGHTVQGTLQKLQDEGTGTDSHIQHQTSHSAKHITILQLPGTATRVWLLIRTAEKTYCGINNLSSHVAIAKTLTGGATEPQLKDILLCVPHLPTTVICCVLQSSHRSVRSRALKECRPHLAHLGASSI